MFAVLASAVAAPAGEPGLRLATFDIDATPPVGAHMAYDPVLKSWDLSLRARGIILLGSGDPIVLCAVDWIGIGNEGYDVFRGTLAEAAGTQPSRVALHALHQHDAPDCDFSAERILKSAGLDAMSYDGTFAREVLARLRAALPAAITRAQPVVELGLGEARVEHVASNRRILGPDGKVRATRYTACKDPALQAEPEGTIDPVVSLVSFWGTNQPLAVLSYYAVHPQSYYRTGVPNPDFPGVARFFRQLAVPSALHVHFNGAGGNLGAGKYNDGTPENRLRLAERLADGMRRAWEATRREPIVAGDVAWRVRPALLPAASHLREEELRARMQGKDAAFFLSGGAAKLAWLERCRQGRTIDITCLCVKSARVLHMPGELFVEYQLGAKAFRPEHFVAMASYGDYGPGYVGTAIAYEQGGYETSPASSNVGPEVEQTLMEAVRALLAEPPVPGLLP
jgi:hypothetical protein